MRFERIDDETLKFYISYNDIENRGFSREELWMDRKRGEEFFWKLMNEVSDEHTKEFMSDGPLWIQVHAFDRGIEVIVSKSQSENKSVFGLSSKHDDFELQQLLDETFNDDDDIDNKKDKDDLIEDFLETQESMDVEEFEKLKEMLQEEMERDYTRPFIVKFDDIDTLIDYSYRQEEDETLYDDLLLSYNNSFYYLVFFTNEGHPYAEKMKLNLLEYGERSDRNEAVLIEYGKTIMAYNVRRQLRKQFEIKK